MRVRTAAILGIALMVLGGAAHAQQPDMSQVQIKTTKIAGNFYTLDGQGGTIGVLSGPDGVLMVDAQFAPLSDKIVAAIKQISDGRIRFLINTHVHGDHTGGNENIAKQGATIFARENLRARLMKPAPAANGQPAPPAPPMAVPVVTFDAPITFHMNGEDVQLIPVPVAHTDGDTMVYFPNANVIMTGDFYRSTGYPNIDRANGGTMNGMLAGFDAIYLGAIGAPGVPDGVSAALILAIRQRFDQYVNLRPMRLLPGLSSPLANRGASEIDMVCVRENSEGEYSGVGGRIHRGTPHEVAQQVGVFTRHGIERILRYAFELAAARPRKMLASATKSNALTHSMVLWDEVAEMVRKDYPSVDYRKYHVDALAARMITHPQTLDVMVTSNLFGDILTDIGSAISGSLGIAPGANINPGRTFPSMFEPIHGSAPDIAGKGIANPIGAIWAGALMLDHLGRRDLHDRVVSAIERVIAGGKLRTPDLGGTATTRDVANAIVAEI